MKFLRHVGTLRDTGHRVVVVFRKLPDEPESCLVVETDSLPDRYHQTLMECLESITAQETMEFYEYAQRQFFHDGGNLLTTLHTKGWLRKIATDRVTMRPRIDVEINLSELNRNIDQIAAGKGEIVEDAEPAADESVLDDKTLAANLRSQADIFERQAADLRKQADSLDPPQVTKRARTVKRNEITA